MPPFVLDASVALSWCFQDEMTAESAAILSALESTHAVVPALWPFEIANGLVSAGRKNRVQPDGVSAYLGLLRRLPIFVERREPIWICEATVALARTHSLSAYDAAYLELAKREGLLLASLDETLKGVAKAIGVGHLIV
jgi:predicted nucleic acid-binding protein